MDKEIQKPEISIAVEQINVDQASINNAPDIDNLTILPTRNLVLFPGVTISISLQRPQSVAIAERANKQGRPIGIVCQTDPDEETPSRRSLYKYGVIADVLKVINLPDGEKTAIVVGRDAFRITGAGTSRSRDHISARVELMDPELPKVKMHQFASMVETIMLTFKRIATSISEGMSHLATGLTNCDNPLTALNTLCTHLPAEIPDKIKQLSQKSLLTRAKNLLEILLRKEQELQVYMEIMSRARTEMDDEQKRVFLRQQLETIQTQLYGDNEDGLNELEARAAQVDLSAQARTAVEKELRKLRKTDPRNPEYSVMSSYVDTVLDLPWQIYSEPKHDFTQAKAELDSDHSGLEKVKERILEQLAVIMHNPDAASPIICLVGPPGVGKTSLGKSIAEALGRDYQRVSLGGLSDEAEIRGHRRTYIGAMPGRIIEAMKRSKTANPVLVLDEIDKIGKDYKGDPAAALLEVLDPEQNCHFHDNYIDVDFDLSKVMFIATANSLAPLAQPLLDRLEVIDISGYLQEEKVEIARSHLIGRIFDKLKISPDAFSIPDDTINAIIDGYTAESGVRQLEKHLSAIGRKYVLALMSGKHFPSEVSPSDLPDLLGVPHYNRDKYEGNDFAGVVTGLAWTQSGGEILLVETSLAPGKGERLSLTGNLGDVMKESATLALQWVKAHAADLGINREVLEKNDIHLHFPEGAIPKDGPSAGITIATSIVSALTGRKVRERVAMTGEITLRGKVLPVGGIKEKILAAKRAGITDIVLSEANRKDIADIEPKYISGLNFHYAETVMQVIDFAVTDQIATLK